MKSDIKFRKPSGHFPPFYDKNKSSLPEKMKMHVKLEKKNKLGILLNE